MTTMSESQAPAGWYDDGTGQQRWWDGAQWGAYAVSEPKKSSWQIAQEQVADRRNRRVEAAASKKAARTTPTDQGISGLTKHASKVIGQHLRGEDVEAVLQSSFGDAAVLTPTRIIISKGSIGSSASTFDRTRIQGIFVEAGTLHVDVIVATGVLAQGPLEVQPNVVHLQRAMLEMAHAFADKAQIAQATSASIAPDALDQLRKLGELRDAGVLTDDEFAAKKAELLARL